MEPVVTREHRTATGGRGVVETQGTVTEVPTAMATSRTLTSAPSAYRAASLVWLLVGIVNTVLGFDFVFRAANANDTGFASFIYSLGAVLGAPFDGIFGISRAIGTTAVLRWSDLVAIAVYTLCGYAVARLVRIMSAPADNVA